MTKQTHAVTVSFEGGSAPWRAECSCGWHAVSSWTEALALCQGEIHLRNTAEPIKPLVKFG